MTERGQTIPPPRRLADLEFAQDLTRYMVALIPLPESLRQRAAE